MSIWIIGAFYISRSFPQLRSSWESEMYRLEQEDITTYKRFQEGLQSFFIQHQNTNSEEGFEKVTNVGTLYFKNQLT